MTRKTIFAVTILAATAIGGTAFAASDHDHNHKSGGNSNQGMMQGGGFDMMGDTSGMMGMMQRMHENMTQMMDADGDGNVTPEEMRTQMQAALAQHDSDGDGGLSITEFEALHNTMMRGMMVDRFQHLDADGDGNVTPEEMMAPAAMMERMRKGMMQRPVQSDNDESTND